MNIVSAIVRLRNNHIKSDIPSLAHVRESVLFNILMITSLIGFVAYIPSMIGAIHIGYYDTVIIDTAFYGWVLYLLFSKELSYKQRALGFVVPILLLSVYLVGRFGVEGAGFLWLFVAPVLSGILFGLKEGILSLLVIAVTLIVFGTMIRYFDIFPKLDGQNPLLYWVIMSGNTVVIIALLVVSVSVMVGALTRIIDRLNVKIKALSDMEDTTIEAFAKLAECRDTETGYHIERTKAYVEVIAETLRNDPCYKEILTKEYIDMLCKSAPLHDIGKIGIPDTILLKEGKLTEAEMEVMKRHTTYGRDVLLGSDKKLGSNSFLKLAAEIAYTHQERWDGSGYPRGLTGEEIPISGRIMAIADVYDALRSKRPYKEPYTHKESIDYLKRNGGKLFDPHIIDLLPAYEKKLDDIYRENDYEGSCKFIRE